MTDNGEINRYNYNLQIMRIEEELKLDYSDVLFSPKKYIKKPKDVNLLNLQI